MSAREVFWMLATGLFCGAVFGAIDPPVWVGFICSAVVGGIAQRIYRRVTGEGPR